MKNDQNARDQSSVNRACSSAASSSTSARATSTETTPVLATKETPSEVPTGAGYVACCYNGTSNLQL